MRTFLGLDIGTTNIKAHVAAEDGTVLSGGAAGVGVRFGADGAAEQDMEEIWTGVGEAIRQAVRPLDASRIAAAGVSSQAGALQVLDSSGRCRGPVIGWQDSRGAPWDQAMTARMGPQWFSRHSGTPRSFLTVGQILRLREQGTLRPDSPVGWVGDVIVGRLCGRRAHDLTSLSEAGLCNPSEGREDGELLALLGLKRGMLPDLLEVTREAGRLLPDVARAFGLPAGIPVGPAVHDQYAAATGCGVVRCGDAMLGAGTAWALLALSATLEPPAGPIAITGRHVVPGVYGQLLTMVNGGACVAWAAGLLNRGATSVREIDALVQEAPPGSDGLRFRPLLSPLGGAGLNGSAAGRLDGLRITHTSAHVLRSLVEGLACELRRHMGFLDQEKSAVDRLVMCGKAATSSVTPGIIADTIDLPVDCAAAPDTSSLGAAVLARALVERGADLAELADAMKPAVVRVEPGPGRSEAQARFREYLQAVRA
jgi:xylulokinase